MRSQVGTVARLGLTPLKGGAHSHPQTLAVTAGGPVDDRRFALLEEHRSRGTAVLRTAESPALLRLHATLGTHGALHLQLPGGASFAVEPDTPPGPAVRADYWGRSPALDPLPGPWDDELSRLVGRPVRLARAQTQGAVVYAEPVSLVTTSSLRELARRAGARWVDDERFRATALVDTGTAEPFVEDAWVGRHLRLGEVLVRVRSHLARCPVTRLVPGTGERADDDPLRLLAADRIVGGEIVFGVGADVLAEGTLRVGDTVTGHSGVAT